MKMDALSNKFTEESLSAIRTETLKSILVKYVEENELKSVVDLDDIEFSPLKTDIDRYCILWLFKRQAANKLFYFEIDS